MSEVITLSSSADALISKCDKLIQEQINDSYNQLSMMKYNEGVLVKELSKENNDLYLLIATITKISNFQQASFEMLGQMRFDNLELYSNKSSQFILKLEERLAERTKQIRTNTEQLTVIKQSLIDTYFVYIEQDTNLDVKKLIRDLFIGMNAATEFIIDGSYIIRLLWQNNLLSEDDIQIIQSETAKLKHKLMDQSRDTNPDYPILQHYDLAPSTTMISMDDIFDRYFGAKYSGSSIEAQLKLLSDPSIAFIVIFKPNKEYYYNSNHLMNAQLSTNTDAGVDKRMIDIMRVLYEYEPQKRLPTSTQHISSYNYYDNKNSIIYVLWTNDYIRFRFREAPIDNSLAKKLLVSRPSQIIDKINKMYATKIEKRLTERSMDTYKQSKYLYFDSENDEQAYLQTANTQLLKYVKKIKFGKSATLSNSIKMDMISIFESLLDSFKPFRINGKVPIAARIGYLSVSMDCVNNIYRSLIKLNHADLTTIYDIESAIKINLIANENPYSKFLSCYFLNLQTKSK